MIEERENQLTRLFTIVLAGAFYPTSAVIEDEDYPTTDEEFTEDEIPETQGTEPGQEAIASAV
jgi:hypothetical protein